MTDCLLVAAVDVVDVVEFADGLEFDDFAVGWVTDCVLVESVDVVGVVEFDDDL